MKKLSRKSVLLFAAVLALGAFAMPSMASAGGWDPIGTHTLTSPALSWTIPALGFGSVCHLALDVDANRSSVLTITGATFKACSGTGSAAGCALDAVSVNTPMWAVDGAVTNDLKFTNVNFNVSYTAGCSFAGSVMNVAGTLTTGPLNNATHALSLTGSTGLTATLSGSSLGPISLGGTLTDTAGTLTLS
jgi:hypothetical protein